MRRSLAALAALCALACVLDVFDVPAAHAVFADEVPAKVPPASPGSAATKERAAQKKAAPSQGRVWFAEAAAWVRGDDLDRSAVRHVHVDLLNVTMSGATGKHDGNFRIWLQLPKRVRLETREMGNTPLTERQVKVLDGEQMWIHTKVGGWARQHATGSEGMRAIRQMQKDRDDFAKLTRFLTLRDLAGPGVRFTDAQQVSFASGHLKGAWMKVRRIAPGGGRMAFLFAGRKDAQGSWHATAPHAVLVPANAQAGTPVEHYVLNGWRRVGKRNLPRRVQRFTQSPKAKLQDGTSKNGHFVRTLLAHPIALRLNTPAPKGTFAAGFPALVGETTKAPAVPKER